MKRLGFVARLGAVLAAPFVPIATPAAVDEIEMLPHAVAVGGQSFEVMVGWDDDAYMAVVDVAGEGFATCGGTIAETLERSRELIAGVLEEAARAR